MDKEKGSHRDPFKYKKKLLNAFKLFGKASKVNHIYYYKKCGENLNFLNDQNKYAKKNY